MLRWAKRRTIFLCVHVHAGVSIERRLWLDACVQSFASPFASKASRHDAITVKLSASNVSRNHGNASVCESKVCKQYAHDSFSAIGDAKISLPNAGKQDVDVQCYDFTACRHQDAKSHSHLVDNDAKIFEFATCIPYAKAHVTNGDVRGSESVASPNDLTSSSKFNDKCLPTSNVSDASCGTQSLHVSLQTLFDHTQNETQKVSSDLKQKIELLESHQFSLSDATILVKKRAFKACSVEQLATVLQVLKNSFPCAKVVHDILVRSSNVLLKPVELVQQKLKILYDFQVDEKVVSKLCGSGRVLSISMESLQERLMFYKDLGLTVEARNVMFSKGPLILSLSIEKRVQPALNFLESTGLTKESILKLACWCPEIFHSSLDSNLIKKYECFRQFGFSANQFARLFLFAGRFSIKGIEGHLQFLQTLGFTDDDVRSMLKKEPSIIGFSSENLKCKVDFLICEQNRDMAEIVRRPYCLKYSLQARMVPRFNVINELGRSKVYSLCTIVCASESKFIKLFGKSANERKQSAACVFSPSSLVCFGRTSRRGYFVS